MVTSVYLLCFRHPWALHLNSTIYAATGQSHQKTLPSQSRSILTLAFCPPGAQEGALSACPHLFCVFFSSPAVWTPRYAPQPGSSLVGRVSPNHSLIRRFLSPSREFPTSPPSASRLFDARVLSAQTKRCDRQKQLHLIPGLSLSSQLAGPGSEEEIQDLAKVLASGYSAHCRFISCLFLSEICPKS